MKSGNSNYSPNILIYLEIGEKTIRLSDVLDNTATLYECADCPPGTIASLVFCIDEIEEKQGIILDHGISPTCKEISFSYSAPEDLELVAA